MASGAKKRRTVTGAVPYVLDKFIVVEANIAKIHATKITATKTPENRQVKPPRILVCKLKLTHQNTR